MQNPLASFQVKPPAHLFSGSGRSKYDSSPAPSRRRRSCSGHMSSQVPTAVVFRDMTSSSPPSLYGDAGAPSYPPWNTAQECRRGRLSRAGEGVQGSASTLVRVVVYHEVSMIANTRQPCIAARSCYRMPWQARKGLSAGTAQQHDELSDFCQVTTQPCCKVKRCHRPCDTHDDTIDQLTEVLTRLSKQRFCYSHSSVLAAEGKRLHAHGSTNIRTQERKGSGPEQTISAQDMCTAPGNAPQAAGLTALLPQGQVRFALKAAHIPQIAHEHRTPCCHRMICPR